MHHHAGRWNRVESPLPRGRCANRHQAHRGRRDPIWLEPARDADEYSSRRSQRYREVACLRGVELYPPFEPSPTFHRFARSEPSVRARGRGRLRLLGRQREVGFQRRSSLQPAPPRPNHRPVRVSLPRSFERQRRGSQEVERPAKCPLASELILRHLAHRAHRRALHPRSGRELRKHREASDHQFQHRSAPAYGREPLLDSRVAQQAVWANRWALWLR